MPRSTTVWAAALVLASFSGSGPLLTTAEAMPAPGPQQTQGRPKYYFPRHVKRQIVTNITAPAVPTSSSSSSSSSSSEQLQSRQFPDFPSFVESLFGSRPDTSSSEGSVSKSEADPATTVTSVEEIIVTETPEPPRNRPTGTGNLREPPAPVSSSTSEDVILPPPGVVSTGSISDVVVTSSPVPTPSPEAPEEAPEEEPEVVVPPSSAPPPSAPASTGGFPEVIVQPSSSEVVERPVASSAIPPAALPSSSEVIDTPAASSEIPPVALPSSSEVVDTPIASSEIPPIALSSEAPAPSPSAERPAGGFLSSLLGGLVGSTGGVPSSTILPTSSEAAQEVIEPSEVPRPVASSTGGLPEVIVTPTPTPFLSEAPPAAESSSFLGPFIVPGSTGGLPETVVQPTSSSSGDLLGGLLSSILSPLAPEPTPEPTPEPVVGSTGGIPSSVVLPTSGLVLSSEEPIVLPLPTSGIVIGITTALGTGEATPTPTVPAQSSEAIPTSESTPVSTDLLGLPSILSSVVSELPGVLPSSVDLGLTQPSASASGIIPPILSSLISDVPPSALPTILSSILTGGETLPSASAPIPLSSDTPPVTPSGVVSPSSGVVPPSSGVVPTPSETASISVLPPATPSATPSPSDGILPSSGTVGTSASASALPPASVSVSVSVPASEVPPSSASSGLPASFTPPASGNATVSTPPITSSAVDSASIPIPTIPTLTSKPSPVISLAPTGSDSATTLVVGTTIIQEQSTSVAPSPTSSGIPASLPKIIAPPEGMPTEVDQDAFMGQVCFKWPLNFPFVAGNDASRQIFYFLPMAIADGLNISTAEVKNFGLKPIDTTGSQGFITTAALFTIPKDLRSKLTAQLRNPADALWHNKNSTVNDLTNLINTACPLPAGPDNSQPNQVVDPISTTPGGVGGGGAIGGDIGASRKINPTSAGIGAGVVAGAIAYGAAMFFVARRYRAKRMAHQRSSSVPSTSRMTYGSIPGGATAWMHGARNGRITPGSRGSRGSSSSQGRSVRTQQISAPVMAENSLGWN